jgi:hypothetical protein
MLKLKVTADFNVKRSYFYNDFIKKIKNKKEEK